MPRNLPAVPSSFLGRDRDVTGVADLLVSARLVTITGHAGMGKTRLAVETATRIADRYPDGAWFVELAGLRDPAAVAAAAATAIGVTEEVAPPTPASLAAVLRDRTLLVVLDNCEHLAQACAELAAGLLRDCTGVSLLATSQEPLATAGEQVWRIEPLALPAPDSADDLAALAATPAVALFSERARSQQADFELTADNAPAVVEICRRLDGSPLALELAAARVGALSPEQIARRLDDRFRLLTTGPRTVLPRHQTLRAALDWSHDLLPNAQRVLFRRLAVFAGGWLLDAAAEVCHGEDVDEDTVEDLQADLVRRSLVAHTTGGEPRYRLLDITRQYAGQHLDAAGETGATRDRHAAWCVALAERAEPELATGAQRAWLVRLDAEHDNLRAALTHLLETGDDAQAARLAGALVIFWSIRGHYHEGSTWLGQALAAGGGPPQQRAALLWGAGLLARGLADSATAAAHAADALVLARTLDDTRLTARALGLLGALGVSTRERPGEAMAQLQESVALARQVGDVWCAVGGLVPLGLGHLIAGRPTAARACFEECLALAEQAGNDTSEVHRLHALAGLGRAELAEGDHRAAEKLFTTVHDLAGTLGVPSAAASALRFLGEAARLRGDYDAAETLLNASLERDQTFGAAASAGGLALLGRLALARADAAEAGRLLDEAFTRAADEGQHLEGPRVLIDLGTLARLTGDLPGARARLEEALEAARTAEDEVAVARAFSELALLARAGDDYARSAALHHEALARYRAAGDRPGITGCLEALAGLEAEAGRPRDAARLFGAAQAMRDAGALPRAPIEQPGYDADVARVAQMLGAEDRAAAWAEGASMTPERAVSHAARGRKRRRKDQAATGWGALSERERDAAVLAADGLTNVEIGEQLFLSPRTVQSHLASTYRKLGITSRKELAAEVRRRRWALD